MKLIKNLATFRPLNFFNAKDGKQIQNNLLFRSSHLNKVSDKTMQMLRDKFHISTVIDFRSPIEKDSAPDKQIEGITNVSIPLLDNEDTPIVTKKNRLALLNEIMAQEGGTLQEVINYYKKIVFSKQSIEGFKQAFDILLNNTERKPILFHCTQGKDRTGLFAAMILYALGCSKKTIYRAYMDFNSFNRVKTRLIGVAMLSRYFSFKKAKALNNILVVKQIYLDTAIKETQKKYGSIENYFNNELGLTEEKREKLKQIYYRKKNTLF